jgi:hypothetical protein
MEEIKKGRTTILIDWSYVENVTPEQEKVDQSSIDSAVWAMCDEMEEAV